MVRDLGTELAAAATEEDSAAETRERSSPPADISGRGTPELATQPTASAHAASDNVGLLAPALNHNGVRCADSETAARGASPPSVQADRPCVATATSEPEAQQLASEEERHKDVSMRCERCLVHGDSRAQGLAGTCTSVGCRVRSSSRQSVAASVALCWCTSWRSVRMGRASKGQRLRTARLPSRPDAAIASQARGGCVSLTRRTELLPWPSPELRLNGSMWRARRQDRCATRRTASVYMFGRCDGVTVSLSDSGGVAPRSSSLVALPAARLRPRNLEDFT